MRQKIKETNIFFPIPWYRNYYPISDFNLFQKQIENVSVKFDYSWYKYYDDDLIFIEYHDEKSGKIMANTHPYRGKGNLFNPLFSYEYLNEEKMIRLTAKAEFSPLINAFIIFTILASVFLIKDLIPVTFFCMFFILIQRAFWNPFYRTKTDLCNIIDHINKYGDDGFNLIEEKRQAEKQFEKILKDYDQRAGIDESSQIN